jgi:transcriptional regulator with XRE-family HTH domain
MATKAQHSDTYLKFVPLLRMLREEAELTQRDLGDRLKKPQSWVYNCESGNRRVDVTEFVAWVRACGVEPQIAFARLLEALPAIGSRSPASRRRRN